MDADDRLDADNRERFRRLIGNLPEGPNGFVMKCLCLPNLEAKTATVVDHTRLFRNHPEVRWRYRVHEQIVPAIRKLGGAFQWTDVVIHHVGYRDPALRRCKLERDLRLLLMEQSEQPEDAFTLFNLGCVYQEMEKLEEALPLFRRSLERSDPTDSIVRKLYALIAQCHNHLGKPREALAACREGQVHYADDVEILFQEATAHRHLGDTAAAIRSWEQALQTPPGPHFASMNTGIRGHLTRHNLATAYFDLGCLDPAEAHWNAALAEQPDYVPALLGKAELALRRRRWQDLEGVLQALSRQPQTAVDAAVLRARMHLDRQEFPCARDILRSAIAAHPRAVWPRVILTHVLLQEGRDWQAAEQALRDVLALDPEHKEAQRNLEVLLRQRGRIA
jgi:tetratricopeptide (TPR) repeat protein